MAIRQKIELPLNSGLNQKSGDKFLQPNELTTATNVRFDEHGSIHKRYGVDALSTAVEGDNPVAAGESILGFDEKLLIADGNDAYAYIDATSKWISKGNVLGASWDWDTIYVADDSIGKMDRAEANGITLYAGVATSGTDVTMILVDEVTKTILKTQSTVGDSVKCVAIGDYLVAFVLLDGSTLRSARFNTTDPTAAVTFTTLYSNTASGRYDLDVCAYDSTKCAVLYVNSSTQGQLFYYHTNDTTSDLTTFSERTRNTIISDGGTGFYLATCENGVGTASRLDSSFTSVWGQTFDNIGWILNLEDITAITRPIGDLTVYVKGGTVVYYFGFAAGDGAELYPYDLSNPPPSFNVDDMRLYSDAFLINNIPHMLFQLQDTTLQYRMICVSENGDMVGSFLAGRASELDTSNHGHAICSVDTVSNKIKVAVPVAQPEGNTYNKVAIGEGVLDLSDNKVMGLNVDGSVYLTGGALRQYDGENISEAGFFTFPELPTPTQTTGGSMADGTYLYKGMMEWRDANGKVYRSAPSAALSFTVSGGGGTAAVQFSGFNYDSVTDRSDSVRVLYRTEAGLSNNYYRTTEGTSGTITDTAADATLVSGELLYTVGGELENELPPGCKSIAKWDQRLWVAGLPQPRDVWYSKILLDDEGAGFSSAQIIRFPDDIVAVARLDSRLIAFAKNKIYYIHGEGGDATGAGASYSTPQYITADVGCVNRLSVAETPQGIVFESHKGLYLITRTMELNYIGSRIEKIMETSPSITSVNVMEDAHEVRFTTSDDKVYVWNYEFNQWSEFDYTAADATVWRSKYTFIQSDGTVKKEQADFSDDGSFIEREIQTGWIHLAGIEGYKRIHKIIVTGDYTDEHHLDAYVAYDYDDTEVERFSNTIDAAGEYSFECNPARRKCSAIRIRIKEGWGGAVGASATLEALTLLVSVKPTSNKRAATNKIDGTSI